LRVNFENFGHTTKNKICRLVKLFADLSTRLKCEIHFLAANDIRSYRRDTLRLLSLSGSTPLKNVLTTSSQNNATSKIERRTLKISSN